MGQLRLPVLLSIRDFDADGICRKTNGGGIQPWQSNGSF
jgi:hypothetical protein